MEEQFSIIENYLMVKLPKEIDHHETVSISKRADQYIVKGSVKNIVFDFEETKFMDSSGIGLIMGRYKKITCFGGKVFAIHTDKQIKKILSLSGMCQFVEIMEENGERTK